MRPPTATPQQPASLVPSSYVIARAPIGPEVAKDRGHPSLQIVVGSANRAIVTAVAETRTDPGEFGKCVVGKVLAQRAFGNHPAAESRPLCDRREVHEWVVSFDVFPGRGPRVAGGRHTSHVGAPGHIGGGELGCKIGSPRHAIRAVLGEAEGRAGQEAEVIRHRRVQQSVEARCQGAAFDQVIEVGGFRGADDFFELTVLEDDDGGAGMISTRIGRGEWCDREKEAEREDRGQTPAHRIQE